MTKHSDNQSIECKQIEIYVESANVSLGYDFPTQNQSNTLKLYINYIIEHTTVVSAYRPDLILNQRLASGAISLCLSVK